MVMMKANKEDGVPVFVMMPLESADMVSTPEGRWALNASLQNLKTAGVKCVMMDVWWGLVGKSAPGVYNWSSYDALIDLIDSYGLKVQAVMSMHQCGGNIGDAVYIPLPEWVLAEKETNPDIFYTDKSGWRNPEYILLGADEEVVIAGRTPVQAYADYFTNFRDNFAPLLGTTICEIQVGMGPAGELRYPSYPQSENQWTFPGIGEFQCYDKYLVASLEHAAKLIGKSEYGRIPDDAGSYNDLPEDTGFFRKEKGTWNTPYGKFFLEWYYKALVAHGDRVLGAAGKVFADTGVVISAKVSGIHWHYVTASHAAELTAGYWNNEDNNAYLSLTRLFAQHGTVFNFTCIEMRDYEQAGTPGANSSPESLIRQVALGCRKVRVPLAGENALSRYDVVGFEQILETSRLEFDGAEDSEEGPLVSFTYLRLGEELFLAENFQVFANFVTKMGDPSSTISIGTPSTSAGDDVVNVNGKVGKGQGKNQGNGKSPAKDAVRVDVAHQDKLPGH